MRNSTVFRKSLILFLVFTVFLLLFSLQPRKYSHSTAASLFFKYQEAFQTVADYECGIRTDCITPNNKRILESISHFPEVEKSVNILFRAKVTFICSEGCSNGYVARSEDENYNGINIVTFQVYKEALGKEPEGTPIWLKQCILYSPVYNEEYLKEILENGGFNIIAMISPNWYFIEGMDT